MKAPRQSPDGYVAQWVADADRWALLHWSTDSGLVVTALGDEQVRDWPELAAPSAGTGWPGSDLVEAAWGIIANVGRGDWDSQPSDWRAAAERWRDAYHAQLPRSATPKEVAL